MSLLEKVKSLIGRTDDSPNHIGFMPNKCRKNHIPKFKIRKSVNNQGQMYIPVDARETNGRRPNVSVGDALSLDIFAPDYTSGHGERDKRERYVDVTVTSGNRITIPAEVRHELDICGDDTIAVHAYVGNKE